MKLAKIFFSTMFGALLLSSFVSAANNNSEGCEKSRIVAPERKLSVVRGTVQLDTLKIFPDGDIDNTSGPSSTASIVVGKKFSISPVAALSPNFVVRFPDITNSVLPTLPPSKQYTRIYELEFNVLFDCKFSERPTVVLQIESEALFNSGTAYVSNFAANVLSVTKKGFTVHVFLFVNDFTLATNTPPFISPNVNNILNSIPGNTRVNFEAIGTK